MARQLKQIAIDNFPSLWVRWRLFQRPRSAEIELDLLKKIVRRDDVTIDVGANLGLYTRKLARLSREVHAFEPSQAVADILRRTTSSKVVVHQAALSDHDGDAELYIPRDGSHLTHSLASVEPQVLDGHDTVAIIVPRRRLDSVIRDDVSFVKIDVEGHEMSVLEGARDLIERCRPVFLVEAEERHRAGATTAVFDFFRARKYDGFFLRGRDIVAIEQFDVGIAQNMEALEGDGGRRQGQQYINNFFFVPLERNGRALLAA
jgi:FkbM family methyltransferase